MNEATGAKHKFISPDDPPLSPSSVAVDGADSGVIAEHQEFIEHVVLPSDTLAGICLRYKVKPAILKRYNQFFGENIQTVKVIKVPAAHLHGTVFHPQMKTKEVVLQTFRNKTDLGQIEARMYLEDHDWDQERALKAWEEDNAWEIASAAKSSKTTRGAVAEATAVVVPVAAIAESRTVSSCYQRDSEIRALPVAKSVVI